MTSGIHWGSWNLSSVNKGGYQTDNILVVDKLGACLNGPDYGHYLLDQRYLSVRVGVADKLR